MNCSKCGEPTPSQEDKLWHLILHKDAQEMKRQAKGVGLIDANYVNRITKAIG